MKSLTLCEACTSASRGAEHGRAATADDDGLGMTEDGGAAGANRLELIIQQGCHMQGVR